MTLADDRQADVDMLFDSDDFGETVDYTPAGGQPVTIPALIDRNGDLGFIKHDTGMVGLPVAREVRADFTGGATGQVAAVWLRRADAPDAGYQDSIVFDGHAWTVRPVFRELG